MAVLPEREPPELQLPERHWVRSTLCATADCVEVSTQGGEVALRDSKDGQGPLLRFDGLAWKQFVLGVLNGEFDAKSD